jgi:hypothetical protein
MTYLIVETRVSPDFVPAVIRIGGRLLSPGIWMAEWCDTSDALVRTLHRSTHSSFLVCQADGDWRLVSGMGPVLSQSATNLI